MNKKYTADDFANARFAEHEDGRLAHRKVMGPDRDIRQWTTTGDNSIGQASDRSMARDGWVPVPTKPTITMSEYKKAVMEGDSFTERLEMLGIEIVPDPEPTNADRLDADIRAVDQHLTSRQLAEALIELGWKKEDK